MTEKELFDNFQENWRGHFTPFMKEDIQKWMDEDGLSPDLINEALRFAVVKGKNTNTHYINGILRNWVSRNILTVEQVHYNEKKRQERISVESKVEITVDFLDCMIATARLWIDDEDFKREQIKDLENQKALLGG